MKKKIAFATLKTSSITTILSVIILITNTTMAVEHIPEYRTRSQDGCHTGGIYPATKRIRNQETTSGQSVLICRNTETYFLSPIVILKPGFKAEAGSKFYAGIPVFDAHFVITTPDAHYPDHDGITQATTTCPMGANAPPVDRHCITPEDLKREVDILNQHFVSETGVRLVRFRYKSTAEWNDLVNAGLTGHNLIRYITDSTHCYGKCDGDGDGIDDDYGNLIMNEFRNTINNPLLRDLNAINVYIYNNRHVEGGNTGHGRRNQNKPYIIIDYDRFDTPEPVFRPVVHEMGHAFGLGHVGDETVSANTDPSNIMSSPDQNNQPCIQGGNNYGNMNCSMGDRTEGFKYRSFHNCLAGPGRKTRQPSDSDFGQVEIIYWYAAEISKALGIIPDKIPVRLPH